MDYPDSRNARLETQMTFPKDVDPKHPDWWDREKLAFALWVSRLVSEADGGTDLSELVLISKLFPEATLHAFGFVDTNGELTKGFEEARIDAIKHLHRGLDVSEKLELVTVFHQICMADDRLVQAELLVLREAAEALGIDVKTLSTHLRALRT